MENRVLKGKLRLDLKNCSFAVTRPTQLCRCRLKIFYWTPKSNFFLSQKTFSEVTDYFNLTLTFTFQMHVYILLNIYISPLHFAWRSTVIALVSGKLPTRKIVPRSGSGFGLALALELGLGGNFPRGQFS